MLLGDFAGAYPPQPQRCGYCHLIIGVGRAHDVPDANEFGERAHSSAAGMLASDARRADGDVLPHDVVAQALSRVAAQQGCALDRLRMLDYEAHRQTDPSLPSLADVLATFGGWKKARRHADEASADAQPTALAG